jgi:hypothetical protein
MLRGVLRGIKRFVLWDYARATWQYDVMVGLILAFLFLTPRAWFRDQPRVPRASQIAVLPGAHASSVFWIERELLEGVPESERATKVWQLLRTQYGAKEQLNRLEPVFDSEQEIKGYMAFTKPK